MLNLALKQGVGWPLDDAAAGKILRWTKVWVSKRVNSSCLNIVPPINPPADQTVRSPPARSLLLGVLAIYWIYNKLVGIDNIKLG